MSKPRISYMQMERIAREVSQAGWELRLVDTPQGSSWTWEHSMTGQQMHGATDAHGRAVGLCLALGQLSGCY